ncbi:unnamed protein product [marine sediment metagenome]|uniref:Peptidase M15A C-terminal domain-containing protein n=1 Tax=marine sediment metagenome TaxID=412755 RepID=X1NKQ8_9ZZZZ
MNNIKIAKNFNLKEFQCPCCKRVMIDSKLLEGLVMLRIMLNKPIYITSGYRCTKENERVKGYKISYHMHGMAADIKVKDISIKELADLAQDIGFKGIGEYKKHLHLDIRQDLYRWKD